MKHTIRDCIIFLFDVLGFSFLYRTYMKRKGPLVRVICFHDVADATWFEDVISMLTLQYALITPAEFRAGEFDFEKINILVTFDDGYQSWIDNCLPVLQKYNTKAIFFINSGLLDVAENQESTDAFIKNRILISPKKPLTWEGARRILNEGHTIGGHTVTHPNLALLQGTELLNEIENDKKRLEVELGTTLSDFAYPFGTRKHFSANTTKITSILYSWQYSAITGFYHSHHKGAIPRTLLENNQTLASVKSWIKGGYDCFDFIKR